MSIFFDVGFLGQPPLCCAGLSAYCVPLPIPAAPPNGIFLAMDAIHAKLMDICIMEKGSKPNVMAWFSLIMSTLFIFGAIGIAMGAVDHNEMVANNKVLISIILLLYGLFRFYRSLRMLRGRDDILN